MRLMLLMWVMLMSGCALFRPAPEPLAPAFAATPVIAQQQWRVEYRGEVYPLLAVAARRELGFRLTLMNNFGMRLAEVDGSEKMPLVTTHLSHPLDHHWQALVAAFQWGFWPEAELARVTDLQVSTGANSRQVSRSAIVRADVDYYDGAELLIATWQGRVIIKTQEFALDIHSYAVSESASNPGHARGATR